MSRVVPPQGAGTCRGARAGRWSRPISFLAEPSIRRQLIFWLVLPLSIALICSALIAYKLAMDFVTHAYDRGLYDSALDLSRRLRLSEGRLNVDLPAAAVDMLEIDELDRVYYEIRTHGGELVVGQAGLPRPSVAAEPGRPVYYYGRFRDQSLRAVALRVSYDPNDKQALALVIVAETLVRRQLLANEILAGIALSQLVLILMVGISIYLGVGHGLLPLGHLRQQIESRSHRDLNALDEPHTPTEVRPLVHAINALMQRLQHALAAQQRFIADAAHQLRTPLAGLKTHAELALREESIEGMRERLQTLMLAVDRSARLAHQLLTLARADPEANAAIALGPVDLSAIAREVTSEWVPRAIERDIDLGFGSAPDTVPVRGNAVLLREMLANLVDNAIRYSQAGGRVTVAVEALGDAAVLSVEDDGPGIPAADQQRVFERFQRLDDASSEGCGLGLAIVREIAEAHNAAVELTSGSHGKGARVSVRFTCQPTRS